MNMAVQRAFPWLPENNINNIDRLMLSFLGKEKDKNEEEVEL